MGFALAILGVLNWYWTDDTRTLSLPTDTSGFDLGDVRVSTTQLVALALAATITGRHRDLPAPLVDRHVDARARRRP